MKINAGRDVTGIWWKSDGEKEDFDQKKGWEGLLAVKIIPTEGNKIKWCRNKPRVCSEMVFG